MGTPNSASKNPGGSISAILRLKELQLHALELGWVHSVRISEEKCKEINQSAEENLVSLSVHAPYYINLNADDDEWPKSRQRLMDAAYFGNLAGATDIIFHPGSYFSKTSSEVLRIAIPRLQGCIQDLREVDNLVFLRPETMGKQSMLGSFEDTMIMSKEVEGVLPCLDFAHLHARPGDGSVNSIKEWELLIYHYLKTLGEESISHLHIHVSGIEYTQMGEKKHLPLRESDFQIENLLSLLKQSHCNGRILCESPILEEDAVYMQTYWECI